MEKESETRLEEWQALCLANSSVPLHFSQMLPKGCVALWGCACKTHLNFVSQQYFSSENKVVEGSFNLAYKDIAQPEGWRVIN